MTGLIDDYLVSLRPYLRGTGRVGRRLAVEAEAHLRESADELAAGNAVDADIEQLAVARFGRVDAVGPELRATAGRRLVNRHAVQSAIILPLVAALVGWWWASWQWSEFATHATAFVFLPVATTICACMIVVLAIRTAWGRRPDASRTTRRRRNLALLTLSLLVLHTTTAFAVLTHPAVILSDWRWEASSSQTTTAPAPVPYKAPPGCPDNAVDAINRRDAFGPPLSDQERSALLSCIWGNVDGTTIHVSKEAAEGFMTAITAPFIFAFYFVIALVLAVAVFAALVTTFVSAARDRRRLASLTLA